MPSSLPEIEQHGIYQCHVNVSITMPDKQVVPIAVTWNSATAASAIPSRFLDCLDWFSDR